MLMQLRMPSTRWTTKNLTAEHCAFLKHVSAKASAVADKAAAAVIAAAAVVVRVAITGKVHRT
jgi:hypothetical protein